MLATSSAPLAAQTLLVSEREHACEDKFWTITFCEALHTISVEVCWIELNRTGEPPRLLRLFCLRNITFIQRAGQSTLDTDRGARVVEGED